jgi:phage terminase large subunit GpA-like protein
MLLKGVWAPDGCTVNPAGEIKGNLPHTTKRGFTINALYSPWLSFSEIAAEFLNCKDKVEELMNFVNSWLAEIWEEKVEDPKEEKIHKLVDPYTEGIVPAGGIVLTAGIDVQLDYFIGVIRAWGIGWGSWLIRAFRAETWADVKAIILDTAYKRSDGVLLPVFSTSIDSGFRTDEVYEFCVLHREGCRPVKGDDKLTTMPFVVSRIERKFDTGSTIEGGVSLWRFNANFYKDKVSRLMSAEPGDPGRWRIHMNPAADYVKQLCGEHKVIKRDKKQAITRYVWEKKTHSTPNHFWDAEVMACVSADIIGVGNLRPEDQSPIVYQPENERREGTRWLPRGNSNWIKRS